MIIYKSTNTLNGKAYIGQTNRSLNERKEEHIKAALKMREGKNYFHWAIVEYGEESFKWEILAKCKSQSELNELEKFFIKKKKTNDSKYGYNGSFGGQGEKRKKKLSELIRNWPKGIVKLSTTLGSEGYTKDLLKKYVKSEWLDSLGYGAFKLHNDDVKWWGALSSLQKVKKIFIRPAGKTALDIQMNKDLLTNNYKQIQLFGGVGESLQKWYKNQEWMKTTNYTQTNLFGDKISNYMSEVEIQGIRLKVSSAEMATMEMLHLVPKDQSFDEAAKIIEGLTTLRPRQVQELLEKCNSKKVKRLFLFMAERSQHSWLKELVSDKINLGSGKRSVVKNGVLDKKYQITVPKEYA